MRFKIGDRVRIKSLDWYNENKNECGNVDCGFKQFTYEMSKFCGQTMIITDISSLNEMTMGMSAHYWTDEMIEGLVEEETKFGTASNPIEIKSNANCLTRERVDALAIKIDEELPFGNPYEWECPEGYQFIDENGNVINATKIFLEKKSPKTDNIIKWLREHDMTKYIGVLYSGVCSITFDTEKLIKDITEMIGDE